MNYDQTVALHGGSSALARKLGIKPNSVSNWAARGIPKAWQMAIASLDSTPVTSALPASVTIQVGGLEVTITVKPVGGAA
jgi:hypothetical protein